MFEGIFIFQAAVLGFSPNNQGTPKYLQKYGKNTCDLEGENDEN